jgi:hypothetical protein
MKNKTPRSTFCIHDGTRHLAIVEGDPKYIWLADLMFSNEIIGIKVTDTTITLRDQLGVFLTLTFDADPESDYSAGSYALAHFGWVVIFD